jgi:hypothetical protein
VNSPIFAFDSTSTVIIDNAKPIALATRNQNTASAPPGDEGFKCHRNEKPYDPATVRDWVAKFVPSVHRKENTGADGRPLVPWTVVAPDPDAFPPEPGPESEQPKEKTP